MRLSRGVVDEDIDGAQLIRYGSDRAFDRLRIAEFSVDGKALAPLAPKRRSERLRMFLPASIMHGDGGAGVGETRCDAPPNARRPACD